MTVKFEKPTLTGPRVTLRAPTPGPKRLRKLGWIVRQMIRMHGSWKHPVC